jgi:hypothetical protein
MNALLCVALLAPGYGEKDIADRIKAAGETRDDFGWALPETTTDAHLGELCELSYFPFLILTDSKITDKGLWTVSSLRGVSWLNLGGTQITDKGLHHLESMSNLPRLFLYNCPKVTAEGVARLQKALPNCKIYR